MLVHSDFPAERPHPISQLPAGHHKCGSCIACPMAWEINEYVNPSNGFRIKFTDFTSCSSKRIVYLLGCPCGLPYVGSSTRAVKTHVLEHKSRIKNNVTDAPPVGHYQSMQHTPD